MKIDWEVIGLLLLFLIGIIAQASQASSIGTFQQENKIEILSQTGAEEYFDYSFKELNKTHWNSSFCITNPLTAINPQSYSLTALTSNIAFETGASKVQFDTRTRCGWFYIIFPKGFVSGERAKFGNESTEIGTTKTTPFDSAQRSICRDGNGYIHAVWLYNISRIAYANSSNNGTTWNYNYYFQGNVSNSSSYKTYPSIDCNGNNISVSYEDSTFDDLIVGLSTNNGGSWSWQGVRTSCVATYSTIARRGDRVYVAFVTPTSSACGYADGNISYSTNGGSTWTHVKAFDGWYILHMGNQYYDRIVLAVDGTGTASDKVHTVARYYGLDDMGYSFTGMNYRNSSNGGASYTVIGIELPYAYSPALTFNGSNVYYLTSNLAGVYFNSSSDYGATWTGQYLNDTTGKYSYGSISTNYLGYPLAFWTGNDTGSSNFDPVYRNYSGSSWDAKVWIYSDAIQDNYMTASQYFNPASNCSDAIWMNGSYPNYNITWTAVCYSSSTTQTYSRSASDCITFSDNGARNSTLIRTGSGFLVFLDSDSRNTSMFRLSSEYISFSDKGYIGLYRSISDALGFSDSISRNSSLYRIGVELLSFLDADGRNTSLYISVGSYLSFMDSGLRNTSLVRSSSDYIAFVDGAGRNSSLLRSIAEYMSFSDIAVRNSTLFRHVSDNLIYLDKASKGGWLVRTAQDYLAYSEYVSSVLMPLLGNVTQLASQYIPTSTDPFVNASIIPYGFLLVSGTCAGLFGFLRWKNGRGISRQSEV